MARQILPLAPIHDLMKSVGGILVSREVVLKLEKHLEAEIRAITAKALKFTRHARRTKIMVSDLDMALKEM